MLVREGMSEVVLTVGPGHTLREAARRWPNAASAPPSCSIRAQAGPGVITERDILRSVGAGEDPDEERVADHLTANLTFAAPDWSLEQAASDDGPRRLPAPGRGRRRRARRDPLDARHRARSGPATARAASCRPRQRALDAPQRRPAALVVLFGQLVDVATGVADPDPGRDDEQDQADDREPPARASCRSPCSVIRDRDQQRQQRSARGDGSPRRRAASRRVVRRSRWT